ncbi:MAG: hypothetical protein PVS2B2_26960 [Candidatus Acidiferrum sp.]
MRDRDDIPGPSSDKGRSQMNISESKMRLLAAREGYVLRKSRCRITDDPRYGGYMVIEPTRNFAVLGINPWPFSASLEEACDWLSEPA